MRILSHNIDGFTRENMERITDMALHLPQITNVNVLFPLDSCLFASIHVYVGNLCWNVIEHLTMIGLGCVL